MEKGRDEEELLREPAETEEMPGPPAEGTVNNAPGPAADSAANGAHSPAADSAAHQKPDPAAQHSTSIPTADSVAHDAPGLLELIYGVLFDTARTFRRLASAPPIRHTLIIVTLVNAAGALVSVFTIQAVTPPGFSEWEIFTAGLVPSVALIGFFWWYFKWLGYGAVLHLTAQLLGGANGPKATLVVYGLAALPGLFLLPIQAVIVAAGLGEAASARLLGPAGLGVFVWGLVVLVIGLREVHGLTTKRAVWTVLLPAAAVAALVIPAVVILVFGLSSSLAGTLVPF